MNWLLTQVATWWWVSALAVSAFGGIGSVVLFTSVKPQALGSAAKETRA